MAGSVNKVVLVGNLGQDPELRRTPSGASVCNISLATTDRYTDKKTGAKSESTEWHNLVLWNKTAENACEYLKKGSSIFCEGNLKTQSWTDEKEVRHYKTSIHVQSLQYLDKLPKNEN